MLNRVFSVLVLAFLTASCNAVGPTYQRPDIPLEQRFALSPNDPLNTAAQDAWWLGLDDPLLDRLMTRALAQNLDVQTSVARIRQAQAQLRATGIGAQLSGDADLIARGTWTDTSESDTAQARIAPAFVLDLFGENQRRREAAQAQLDRTVFDTAASRLALQLAMVTNYVDLRYFQEIEALQERSIRNQLRVVDAVRQREALLAESKITMRRAEAELQLQRALLPQIKQGQNAAVLRLASLLAEPAAPLMRELASKRAQPRPGHDAVPGLPIGLLKNRPDVRAAEAALRAAVAQVGVTEAQLLPAISLNGALTVGADSTLSLGPSIAVPLFNRTARVANRDIALATAEEAELDWRKTVRQSIEEVQLNLSHLQTSDKEVIALSAAVSKFRDAARLSREAFQLQAITHLEILDAEDSLSQTELLLINGRRKHVQAWARLNVAIGQGWQAQMADTAKPAVQ